MVHPPRIEKYNDLFRLFISPPNFIIHCVMYHNTNKTVASLVRLLTSISEHRWSVGT
ncbi:hypothetical protein RchiOBHm_Chr6g0276091 [Rosa chinensis]|uniref:Uncharacterized protein n=1 Tax=Rosa chinensis TaxID=74649 RepID=A0A2P6PS57_ROSCH|nr:hypothetical protein RchiOBHm_Chr6g0276091 [Rosa chinensis]